MPRRIRPLRRNTPCTKPDDLSSSWEKSLLYSLKENAKETKKAKKFKL